MTTVLDKNTGPNEQTASILTTMMTPLTTSILSDEDSFIFNTVTFQSSLRQLIALQYFTQLLRKLKLQINRISYTPTKHTKLDKKTRINFDIDTVGY